MLYVFFILVDMYILPILVVVQFTLIICFILYYTFVLVVISIKLILSATGFWFYLFLRFSTSLSLTYTEVSRDSSTWAYQVTNHYTFNQGTGAKGFCGI